MAVKIITNYSKKLGLPGYSSHQFSVSVETELTNVEDIGATSERLYRQLQEAVDTQIVNFGFVPPDGYGMAPEQSGHYRSEGGSPASTRNGNAPSQIGNSSYGAGRNGHGGQRREVSGDRWNCTEGQRGLIQRVVHEHNLDKTEVEAMAQQLFGCGVTAMDKLQASQLIEDLLEKVGKKPAGQRRWANRQGAQP